MPAGKRTAGRLVVVNVDALELEVGVPAIGAGGVDAVLIADDLGAKKARYTSAAGFLPKRGTRC